MGSLAKIGIVATLVSVLAIAAYHCPCLNKKFGMKTTGIQTLGKTVSNIKWTDCDGTGYPYFTVSDIKILGTFDVGTDVTFITTGTVVKQYTHGFTDTTIKFGIITVYSGVTPVDPPKTNVPGPLYSESKSAITSAVQTGTYTMLLRFQDPSKVKLQCLQISYKLS